MISSLKQNSKC